MPSVTSWRVSAETSSIIRPPSTPPAAFSSSMAISAPRSVLRPVSDANEPMNPTLTGSPAACAAGGVRAAAAPMARAANRGASARWIRYCMTSSWVPFLDSAFRVLPSAAAFRCLVRLVRLVDPVRGFARREPPGRRSGTRARPPRPLDGPPAPPATRRRAGPGRDGRVSGGGAPVPAALPPAAPGRLQGSRGGRSHRRPLPDRPRMMPQ